MRVHEGLANDADEDQYRGSLGGGAEVDGGEAVPVRAISAGPWAHRARAIYVGEGVLRARRPPWAEGRGFLARGVPTAQVVACSVASGRRRPVALTADGLVLAGRGVGRLRIRRGVGRRYVVPPGQEGGPKVIDLPRVDRRRLVHVGEHCERSEL